MPNLSLIQAVVSVVYSALAFVGIVGNLWVLWLLFGQLAKQSPAFKRVASMTTSLSAHSLRRQASVRSMRDSRTSTHWYLVLLSSTDLVNMCIVPMLVVDINWEWRFGQVGCKTFFVGETANKILSPLILAGLSYDRYSVVCSQGAGGFPWLKLALISCLLLCIAAALPMMFTIVYYAQVKSLGPEGPIKCNVEIEHAKYYEFIDMVQFAFCFVVPLCVICMVYIAIICRLYTHRKTSSITTAGRSAYSIYRVARCSAVLVVFYFACWTPYYGLQAYRLASGVYDDAPAPTLPPENVTQPAIVIEEPILLTESPLPAPDSADYEPLDYEYTLSEQLIIIISYMSHSLPYAQAAFNWLLYVYLNRSLRQSSGSNGNGPTPSMLSQRSAVPTTAPTTNGCARLNHHRGPPAGQHLELMSTNSNSQMSCAVPLMNGSHQRLMMMNGNNDNGSLTNCHELPAKRSTVSCCVEKISSATKISKASSGYQGSIRCSYAHNRALSLTKYSIGVATNSTCSNSDDVQL